MNTLLTGKYVVVTFAIFVYYVTLSRDPLWLSQLSFAKFVIFVILSIIATSLMAPFRFWYIILSICAILFLPSSFSRPRRIFQVVFFFPFFMNSVLFLPFFFAEIMAKIRWPTCLVIFEGIFLKKLLGSSISELTFNRNACFVFLPR